MSKKTLMGLVVLLAVLVGVMRMSGRHSPSSGGQEGSEPGSLLAGMDMNTVRAIAIEDGASTTHLARVDGIWCVSEQDNFPADFIRLREMMRSIDGMEKGQIADEGSAHLAEYGLAAGEEPAPLRITLEEEKGTRVLNLGKTRAPQEGGSPWGSPPGRYARVDEGPVLLLKEDLRMVQADSDQWWDRSLLDVAPESIRQIEASSADGSYEIQRGTNGAFSLVGSSGKEEVDVAAGNRLFSALRNFRADGLMPAGAEESDAAFTNASQYKAEAEGATYRVSLGETQPNGGGGTRVRIEVTASTNATPEQQSAVAVAGKKLNNRTFLIPAHLADSMILKKDVLVRKPEPTPAPAPALAPEPPPVPADDIPSADSPAS